MRPVHYQYAIELELAAKGIEPNTTEFLGKAARGGLYINYIAIVAVYTLLYIP